MFPGWPVARAFPTGPVSPFVLAAVSSAAMIAAGTVTRKGRIRSGQRRWPSSWRVPEQAASRAMGG